MLSKMLFVLMAFFSTYSLNALQIWKEQELYLEESVQWETVHFDDEDCGYTAGFPGEAATGISGDYAYAQSQLGNTSFGITLDYTRRFLPNSKKEFLKAIESGIPQKITTTLISPPSNILFAAEVFFFEKPKLLRVYFSKNQLYFASVSGEDLHLAPLFFDKFEVTK